MMKNIGFIIALLLCGVSYGQEPQTVYSIAKERKPIEWYQEQEKLWKKEIKKDKRNAAAWSNYYEAVRAQNNLSWGDTEKQEELREKMNKLVNECYKTIPKTFEANYMMYRNFVTHTTEDEHIKYLEKAYEIDPLDTRTYENFIVHYELKGNKTKRDVFLEKFFRANMLAGSVYNWGYNLLSELDENAIVFTAGDNDTYACWGLQVAKDFRPDVTVINTSLMTVDDYRKQLLKKKGIDPSEWRLDQSQSYEDMEDRKFKILRHIMGNEQGVPVYFAGTAVYQVEEKLGEDLYLTGLAYKYCENEMDNTSIIRRNYEKKYLLDHLTMTFAFNIQDNISDQLNATYLPAFVKLYKHYQLAEDIEAMKQLEKYLVSISKKAGQYETIKELLAH